MIGTVLANRYQVLQLLGEGGMGQVYLATDLRLGRKVALKFLTSTLQDNPEAKKRFLQEARSAAALDHPFICSIFDISEGEDDSDAFIAMEFVSGETLQNKLRREPLDIKEAQSVGQLNEENPGQTAVLRRAHELRLDEEVVDAAAADRGVEGAESQTLPERPGRDRLGY